MQPQCNHNARQAGGYGKVVSQVLIGLRTVKGTKQLKLDPTIFDSLQKEKVQVRSGIRLLALCGDCDRFSELFAVARGSLHLCAAAIRRPFSNPPTQIIRSCDCSSFRLSTLTPNPNPTPTPTPNPNPQPQVGDVIYIEANSGAVKRVGRCDAYATEFDLEAEEYVPLPKVGGGSGLMLMFVGVGVGIWGDSSGIGLGGVGWGGCGLAGREGVALGSGSRE